MPGQNKAQIMKRRLPAPPYKYDRKEVVEKMFKWAEKETSTIFVDFCFQEKIPRNAINTMVYESEEFADAYELVKMKLAERRERHLNREQMHVHAYNRYQACYDPFLHEHETKEKDLEAQRKKEQEAAAATNLVELAKMAAEGQICQKDEGCQ